MTLRSRARSLITGDDRIERLEQELRGVHDAIDAMRREQAATLDGLRRSVADAVDDLAERRAALDGRDADVAD
ncbi:MAG: hypothetical protein RIB65_04695 [Ilumatobacter fluminis]|uniref:hypothetical protein n=1 Tax=Ilumatobacter fluminis TaxID=467091 RepID=UPI0032EC4EFC